MSDNIIDRTDTAERTPVQSCRGLLVWQKSFMVAKQIYTLTSQFPSEEKFGLISQMRRAAVSVASNIAEGPARNTTAEFVQFFSYAEGSLAELDAQLIIAIELGFAASEPTRLSVAVVDELRRMLNGLSRQLGDKN